MTSGAGSRTAERQRGGENTGIDAEITKARDADPTARSYLTAMCHSLRKFVALRGPGPFARTVTLETQQSKLR